MSRDFIEIKQGISVNVDAIEAIIEISDPKKPNILSKVYTANNSYPSTLSRQAILQIADMSEVEEEEPLKQALNILKQSENFAG